MYRQTFELPRQRNSYHIGFHCNRNNRQRFENRLFHDISENLMHQSVAKTQNAMYVYISKYIYI